jgi:xylose dehydrogenase (NAD/NADP)
MLPNVRWGVLGAAGINDSFVPGLKKAAGAELVAIASRSEERAEQEAVRWGATRSYSDYGRLLDDPNIDAVYIPLPNHIHAEWTVRALEAGKHVLCEKPLALSHGEMDMITKAADESGRLVLEAFMYRYAPRWLRTLELIKDGAIGEPRIVNIGFAFKQYPASYNIRFDPAAGGGIVWDMGCYVTAMSRDLFGGEPVQVFGYGDRRPGAEVTTSVETLLRFPGAKTSVGFTSFDYPNPYSQVQVVGADGWIALPGTGMRAEPFTRLLLHRGPDEVFASGKEPHCTEFPYADPYQLEVEHFNECVRGTTSPNFGLDDSARNLEALLALTESVATGQPGDMSAR